MKTNLIEEHVANFIKGISLKDRNELLPLFLTGMHLGYVQNMLNKMEIHSNGPYRIIIGERPVLRKVHLHVSTTPKKGITILCSTALNNQRMKDRLKVSMDISEVTCKSCLSIYNSESVRSRYSE